MKIKELLKLAENRLDFGGIDRAKQDSEILLEDFLQVDKAFLFLHMGDELDDKRCEGYLNTVDERASGKPLQYITNKQNFMGLELYVDERVLIPRPETETLVEHILKRLETERKGLGSIDILDMCTGSGAIAVKLARDLSKSNIVAVDISGAALDVAEKNIESQNLQKRIKLLEGNMFAPFKVKRNGKGKRAFDVIVSNPPYIATREIQKLAREVGEFEPVSALDGGPDGLDYYRTIAENAWRFLDKKGMLFLEIGYDQGESVPRLLEETEHYKDIKVIKDLSERDRIIEAATI